MKKTIGLFLALLVFALSYIALSYAARPDMQAVACRGILCAFSGAEPVDTKATAPDALSSITALATCVVQASQAYRIPTGAVIGIMVVEGGRNGQAAGPNTNGTYDLGLMQINSLWVPQLARLWHADYRTAYISVRDNGCENIYVGTWILKQKIVESGTLYSGIAAYHSATRGLGIAYADKVSVSMTPNAPPFLR